MIDPISIIVNALVSGIIMGLQAVGKQAVKESYECLKALIVQRYKVSSIDMLEKSPQSSDVQAILAEELRKSGAEKDDEIVQLSNQLLNMLTTDTPRSDSGNDKKDPDDFFEKADRTAANQAIYDILYTHINAIMDIQGKFPVNNTDLLRTRVTQNKDIPEKVRDDIGSLHDNVKSVIENIALRIEERKYKSAEQAIIDMKSGYVNQHRAIALVQADKKLHVSYQALRTTVEFFSSLNQMIIEKINKSQSSESETRMILGNAILIYELTDFVIGYIEGFSVEGVGEINQIYEETKKKNAEIRKQQQSLLHQVESNNIDTEVKNQTLDDIRLREKSLGVLEQEWLAYIDTIKVLEGELSVIQKKIPTLEVIRENAKIQIDLIQAVAMLQFLKQNVGTMEATILTLEKIKLVSLSPNRVRRLLGIV